jgi:hypothetical protein
VVTVVAVEFVPMRRLGWSCWKLTLEVESTQSSSGWRRNQWSVLLELLA